MDTSLHPSDGIRLLLERLSVGESGEEASYGGGIYTPEHYFEIRCTLNMDGSALVEHKAEDCPEELLTKFENIAKSTARGAKRKLADGLPPWPERVLRWRGPGRG